MLRPLTFDIKKDLEVCTTHTYTLNTLEESREGCMIQFETLPKLYLGSLVQHSTPCHEKMESVIALKLLKSLT